MRRLRDETRELTNALAKKAPPDIVEREAADVANFALFVAATYRERWEQAHRERWEQAHKKDSCEDHHCDD